jgi:hypothetical protein
MEHLLLACDYKTSKIKVKIEENQRVFTYHLGWMIPQRKRTKLVVSATNSVSLCPWALNKFFICGLNLMIKITNQNENLNTLIGY